MCFDSDDEKRLFLVKVREALEAVSESTDVPLDNPAYAAEAKALVDEEIDSFVLFENQLYESRTKLMYYLAMLRNGIDDTDKKQLAAYLEEVIEESIEMLDDFRDFKKMCRNAFKRQKRGYGKLLHRFSRAFHVINVYETLLLSYIDAHPHTEKPFVPDTPISEIEEKHYYDLTWERKIRIIKKRRQLPIRRAE